MRKRGIKRKDGGCCPGHDKYPKETYNNSPRHRALKRRTDTLASKRARLWDKELIRKELRS